MAKSLIKQDARMFRYYFKECLDFYGINAKYYQTKPGKKWTVYGEMKANYYDPVPAKVIFDQAPQVKTLKKLGWVTELDQQQPIVHISYDLPGIEVGCLVEIQDPINPETGRLFRITKMSVGIIYPASITAQIVAVLGVDEEETINPYDGAQTGFLDKPEGVD